GCFSWTPIWLPELFPTRMRATAAGFIFNAPRLISAVAPLIAGTLIVGLGGYGKTATIIGLFYVLGLIAVPFLPETKGKPLPETDTLSPGAGAEQVPRPHAALLATLSSDAPAQPPRRSRPDSRAAARRHTWSGPRASKGSSTGPGTGPGRRPGIRRRPCRSAGRPSSSRCRPAFRRRPP